MPALRQSMALLSHVFGRGGFVAVKIERRNEPTGEQLAASVILTGASALRMMRAERRQMGYISWKDFIPMKSAVCCARRRPRPRISIFLTWCELEPKVARCKKICACWWDLRRSAAACLA